MHYRYVVVQKVTVWSDWQDAERVMALSTANWRLILTSGLENVSPCLLLYSTCSTGHIIHSGQQCGIKTQNRKVLMQHQWKNYRHTNILAQPWKTESSSLYIKLHKWPLENFYCMLWCKCCFRNLSTHFIIKNNKTKHNITQTVCANRGIYVYGKKEC